MHMIEARKLTKKFGEVLAVDAVSFSVDAGEIFGLLGPNGAGKTTTMRMLCCLISRTSGEASVGGIAIGDDIGNGANSLKIRQLIGLVPDNVGLYDELSAYANLDFYGKLYGCSAQERRERIEQMLTLLGLWQQREQPVGGFSKGMKQKVAIVRALIHDPPVLFMDEPTANLDPEAARQVRELILDRKRQGTAIVINTHNLDEAQRLCDRIGILKTRLLAINTPEQLGASHTGEQTVIELAAVTEDIVAAVKHLAPQHLEIDGNRLRITVENPLRENPALVRAIVEAGGQVEFVTSGEPDLESRYMSIVEANA